MAKQTTIYVLDLVPGATVEEKAYGVIAAGYDESGYEDVDNVYNHDFLAMAKDLFRITGARQLTPDETLTAGGPAEWEVTVEGEDHNIEEYEAILDEME